SFDAEATSSIYQATGPNQQVTGGTSGADTLVGGYGGDTLIGRSGQDLFEYNSGGGAESIVETAAGSVNGGNILKFGSGITPASLTLSSAGDPELVLSIGSGSDSVAIEGFNPLDPLQSFPIQSFVFSDGTTLSLPQLLADSAINGTGGSITNADGSVTSYDFTPSGQPIYSAREVDSDGRLIASVARSADGSASKSTYAYNSDGTSTVTEVSTPADGTGSTTTITSYDASGNEVSQQITNPDGSTESDTFNSQGLRVTADYTYADGSTADVAYARNSDGTSSTTDVSTPAGGGGSTTTITSYDASGNEVSQQITNPDGSTESDTFNSQGLRVTADYTYADGSTADVTYTRNSDGTSSTTDVSTPGGGGGSTTTITSYDASGNEVSQQITNPDGSTESDTFNSQGLRVTADYTYADGSTADVTYTRNSDGTSSTTDVTTPAGAGAVTTSVSSYDAQGNQLSQNGYTPSADGSFTDTWSKADGSHGSY